MTKCKRIPDLENKKCKQTLYLQNVKNKKFKQQIYTMWKSVGLQNIKQKSTNCAKKSENQSMICKV